MKTKLLILLTLLLTSQQVQAYTLNGKHWAEDSLTIVLPPSMSDKKIVNRMKYLLWQVRKEVPFKLRLEVLDGAFTSTLDAANYADANKAVVVMYEPGEDYGLGTRVANTGFITSQGGTAVHAAVIRFNDLRYQQVTDGGNINYLTQVTGHECLGHVLGLDHSKKKDGKPSPIMSIGKFNRFRNKHFGFTRDDKRGLRAIY